MIKLFGSISAVIKGIIIDILIYSNIIDRMNKLKSIKIFFFQKNKLTKKFLINLLASIF